MNAVLRAKAMLVDPAAEWMRIEQESGDPAFLLSRYVAWLAAIPAVCGFIGSIIIGVEVSGAGTVRAPVFDGLFGAILGYAETFITVLLLGLVIDLLAPLFGGRKAFGSALKLAVYSYTPVWLAGIFLLLPGLHFLVLTGFYGAYLLATGTPRLMQSPEQKIPAYVAVVVGCALALAYAAAAAKRAVFGIPGL
jgi:Yip1-like protein